MHRPSSNHTAPDHPENNAALQLKLDHLSAALEQILRAHPAGLSEHALLKELQSPAWAILEPVDFRDPAKLYPVHFLVFHALYHLRDRLRRESGLNLDISAMAIRLRPDDNRRTGLPDKTDALAVFYRNLDNLRLSEETIEAMLDDFWRGIRRPLPEALEAACETLELACPPEDIQQANRQFRKLVMTHHPDRGGSKRDVQVINDAIAVIRQHFRNAP